MIQEIYPRKFHNEYRAIMPQDRSFVICFKRNSLLLLNEKFPRLNELNNICNDNSEMIYLFSVDSDAFFLYTGEYIATDAKLHYWNLKHYFEEHIDWQGFVAITSHQLYRWYLENQYCSKCGQKMQNSNDTRAIGCNCGNIVWPKLSPVIIVAIIHEDKLLLTKYASGDYQDYSLVAGFVEIGETLEQAVCREVYEEVGLRVKKTTYYKSQPWAISDSLMIGFWAEVNGNSSIVLDESELSFASWFNRDEIPEQKFNMSIGNEMINMFKNKKTPPI